jgi:hypothetical protein
VRTQAVSCSSDRPHALLAMRPVLAQPRLARCPLPTCPPLRQECERAPHSIPNRIIEAGDAGLRDGWYLR